MSRWYLCVAVLVPRPLVISSRALCRVGDTLLVLVASKALNIIFRLGFRV